MAGFHSIAHRDKIRDLVKQGTVSQEYFDQLAAETGNRVLPARKPEVPKVPAKRRGATRP